MTDTFTAEAQADFDIYSDLHKDAYGFRPRGALAISFLNADEDRRRAMLDEASRDAAREAEFEREAQQAARDAFEARIADTIAIGAGDRRTALRWIIQAEDADIENDQDVEHVLWCLGLSFTTIHDIANEVRVA